ncbi:MULTISPECIES: hypothetical protein [Arthrobacter]|uniref:STAS domain-containing protein n=1 Tax=Arthrobacter oryzae TaxID=409290 RepID=A0A3N0C0B8_9MICC|nr:MULTISPECIES: hypothetical protein [Arthrobacter]QYF90463.1 hypothetical protein KY499_03910 [Arthrobacter sp. PAMC25284]RNL55643.1 hypothetical protein D7003_09505 [Arthrobacter oryzae]
MASKLDVTVAVDMGSGTITVTPSGALTLGNVRGLLPVARRAALLAPGHSVILDLRKLAAAEPGAVQTLCAACPPDTRILAPGLPVTAQATPGRSLRPGTPRTTAPQPAAA